jgi:hypothetical protein
MKKLICNFKKAATVISFFALLTLVGSSVFGQSQTRVGHVNVDGTMYTTVSSGILAGAFNSEFSHHDSTTYMTITAVSIQYSSGNYYLHGTGNASDSSVFYGAWVQLTENGSQDLYISLADDGTNICSGNCCSCGSTKDCPCTGGIGPGTHSCKSSSVTFYAGAGSATLGGFY